jgi:hypothetical protein
MSCLFSMHTACTVHLILPDLISPILGTEYVCMYVRIFVCVCVCVCVCMYVCMYAVS